MGDFKHVDAKINFTLTFSFYYIEPGDLKCLMEPIFYTPHPCLIGFTAGYTSLQYVFQMKLLCHTKKLK